RADPARERDAALVIHRTRSMPGMSPSSISKPTEPRTSIVPLRQLAHARAGDKGDICSIALFAYDPDLYELLVRTVTPPAVHEQFQHRRPGHIERYLLPQLHGMNL